MTPVPPRSSPINAHRLVGDGRTAALVTPDAAVDWWCTPTFDSRPLLWSLLDERGAVSAWKGARSAEVDSEPAGRSTRTTVVVAGGRRVECLDGLVRREPGGSALVRLVRLVDGGEGPVLLRHELALGGFDGPWATWSSDVGVIGERAWRVVGGRSVVAGAVEALAPRLVTTVEAVRDRWSGLMVTPDLFEEFDAERLIDEMDDDDVAAPTLILPKRHGERSHHAMEVLRCCTDASTGAVVASPTTSLPEVLGGDRQFDYRYSWLRDSSLAVSVAAQLGAGDMGTGYIGFLRRLGADGILASPVTTTRGTAVPPEREVPGVAGWGRTTPVRVGNAASGQLQYDAIGTVLEGLLVHARTGGDVDDELWSIVSALADRVCDPPSEPSSGVWELRVPRWLVSADIGRWVALDRAIRIGQWRRPLAARRRPERRWVAARREARERVLSALRPDGSLPQEYPADDRPDDGTHDASALLAVVLGMLPDRDPRAARLVDSTIAALGAGPHMYRYEPGRDDGFEGTEATFVPASWWAVSALAVLGRAGEAEDRANRLCAALPALVPEEIDAASGEGRGNVPLVWSHMEAARALAWVERAAIRRTWGRTGDEVWGLVQFVRLRWRRRRSSGSQRQ